MIKTFSLQLGVHIPDEQPSSHLLQEKYDSESWQSSHKAKEHVL